MADCSYCGTYFEGQGRTCDGCGSPRSARPVTDDDRFFAQIGRAVAQRDTEAVIGWVEAHRPDPDESLEQKWGRRGTKALVVLGILFMFPQLLMIAAVIGMLFMFWIYLPYRGLKVLADWIVK